MVGRCPKNGNTLSLQMFFCITVAPDTYQGNIMRTKTLILWLLLFVAIPSFAYDFQSGDLCYYILSENRVEVTRLAHSYSTTVVIPKSVTYNNKTYSVTSIGVFAFSDCTGLTSVTIPNSVTSIGVFAFSGCTGLTSITIPNSVTSIGNEAFNNVFNIVYSGTATGSPWGAKSVNGYVEGYLVYSDATKATLLRCNCTVTGEIIIPNSVTTIGASAFYGCTGLTSITIPNSVTSIGEGAFNNVFNIVYSGTATGSPWGAKSVNGYIDGYLVYSDATKTALQGCSTAATGTITIPGGVTSIGYNAFLDCTGLTSITIPNSVTTIGVSAFHGCDGLTSVTIPNSVTTIGNEAFASCTGLTSVTIPHSVTSIGDYAFSWCTGLTSVTISEGVKSIGERAFASCTGLASVTIPNSVTSIGEAAFQDTQWYENQPNGVLYIGSVLYKYKGDMPQGTNIVVKDGITTISTMSFNWCTGLTSVTIPNSVTTIGRSAFYGCTGLTSITIPSSVTSIGEGAFCGCTGLTSVTIPHSVTSIGRSAFCGVHNILYFGTAYNIDAPWGAEQMNKGYVDGYLFYADAAKTTLLHCNHTVTGDMIIPNSVTSIEREAFYGCDGLTSVTIPNSVMTIGSDAFCGCTGLTSVVWNAKNCQGWSQSDDSPFYVEKNKSNITSFTFGNDVKSIPSYLCYGMNKLTSIAIPNSVIGIGSYAFSDCSRLTSITIPSSVREVGNSIVSGCRRLDTVVWNAVDCQRWSQYNDSPFYDEKGECSVSYFAFGNGVENIPSYLCYGMNVLSSVTIPNSVQTIGKNAFENCKYLEEVSFGMGIEDIGENAFAGDGRIYSVTCYADITPTIYESTFSGVSSNAELHVLANLVKKYKVNEYWGRFTIVPIGADNTTDGTLSVTPSETDATFTWPTNDNADTYTLTIQKGDMVFCTLTFDANGVLQSMRFAAPSHSGALHTAQAQATGNGFRFVVEGLDRATTYAYSITATDKNETVLTNYSGTFTTQAPTGIEDILFTPSQPTPRKVFRNGQVYILRDDKMYNINGTEM